MSRIVANLYRGFGSTPSLPPTPTLTMTDDGNGNGAIATISGSAVGSTNTVTIFSTNGTQMATASCTGNGTIAFSLPPGFYFATLESTANNLWSAPAATLFFRTTATTNDYGGIIAAIITTMSGDAVLTNPTDGLLAAWSPDGVQAAARSNSIFQRNPPTATPPFPCITISDLVIGPSVSTQSEMPMAGVKMVVQIDVWGLGPALRPILSEIDKVLEYSFWSGALNTAAWKFDDIDTSGTWHAIDVPNTFQTDAGQPIVQWSKDFPVAASSFAN